MILLILLALLILFIVVFVANSNKSLTNEQKREQLLGFYKRNDNMIVEIIKRNDNTTGIVIVNRTYPNAPTYNGFLTEDTTLKVIFSNSIESKGTFELAKTTSTNNTTETLYVNSISWKIGDETEKWIREQPQLNKDDKNFYCKYQNCASIKTASSTDLLGIPACGYCTSSTSLFYLKDGDIDSTIPHSGTCTTELITNSHGSCI
jgi:hypothetical protein